MRGYYKNNIEYREKSKKNSEKWRQANRELLAERNRESRLRNPEKRLVIHAKNRAKKAGIAFNLDYSDVVIPKVCPLLGIPIVMGVGKPVPGSPSLDRIEPELGYVKGNVWVISHRANCIKNDATLEELELIALKLREILTKTGGPIEPPV